MFRGSDFFLCLMLKGSFLNRHYKKLFPTEFWILLFNAPNTIVSELDQTSPTRLLLVRVGNKQWWVRNYSGQQPAAGLSAVTYCHHNHLQGHPQYEELFCQSSCTQLFIGWPGKLGIIFPVTLYKIKVKIKKWRTNLLVISLLPKLSDSRHNYRWPPPTTLFCTI